MCFWLRCCKEQLQVQSSSLSVHSGSTPGGVVPPEKNAKKGGEPELIPSLVLRVLLVTMVKYMYLAWGLRSACAELLVIVMDCGTFLAGLKGKISTAVDECAVNGNHFRLF